MECSFLCFCFEWGYESWEQKSALDQLFIMSFTRRSQAFVKYDEQFFGKFHKSRRRVRRRFALYYTDYQSCYYHSHEGKSFPPRIVTFHSFPLARARSFTTQPCLQAQCNNHSNSSNKQSSKCDLQALGAISRNNCCGCSWCGSGRSGDSTVRSYAGKAGGGGRSGGSLSWTIAVVVISMSDTAN